MNKKIGNVIFKFFAVLFISVLLTGNFCVLADNGDVPYNTYTYWYEYSGSNKKSTFSRPLYEVSKTLTAKSLGLTENFTNLIDSCCQNGKTYLLDSGSSKLVILDSQYQLERVITDVKNPAGETYTFKNASGVFVSKIGEIYIADTDNKRVLVIDEAGNYVREYLLPNSELIPKDFKYKPIKVAIDSKGYLYILSDGSYYGAILYGPDGEFLGFFGANQVKASVKTAFQNIYNKLFSNDVKKSKSQQQIPYQFTDLYIDKHDFVYTATGNTSKESLQTGQIKKLNAGGTNVLKSEDIDFLDSGISISGQNIVSVESDSDGFIYAVDSTYGHIFMFDSECTMVSAFGNGSGSGNQNGSFAFPSSLSINGTDLIVTDKINNSITVFNRTEYGSLVVEAQILTINGHYTSAMPIWEKINKLDSNSQLAYCGLAKGYYGEGNYSKAMQMAKIGCDRETYANAFEKIRNDFLKKTFWIIVLVIILICVAIISIKHLRKKDKKEAVLKRNKALNVYLSLLAHPADSFREIREKKCGSVIIAAILTVLYYVSSVIKDTNGGFAFTVFDSENYNALFVLLRTVGLILLFSLAYWCVSTLLGGLGKISEIYIVTAYSFTPIIIANVCYTILTNVLVPEELGFLNIFMTVMILYTVLLLCIGMMRINDFEFKRFVGVTALSVAGMVVILFLVIVVFLLLQLTWGFVKTIISETFKVIG